MILSNKIHCNTCNTTIESKYRHDFVGCKCPQDIPQEVNTWCAVDGGINYIKRSYGSSADFIDLSTYTEPTMADMPQLEGDTQ